MKNTLYYTHKYILFDYHNFTTLKNCKLLLLKLRCRNMKKYYGYNVITVNQHFFRNDLSICKTVFEQTVLHIHLQYYYS